MWDENTCSKKCSCAFTGYRPHRFPWRHDETDSRCAALKAVLLEQITVLANSGVTNWFSGMAEGADQWCAQIILDLRKERPALKLHCILPYKGQSDRWNELSQERYHSILRQANSVSYVSHDYYDGCMIDRNRRLVESAGWLLAVYNGVRRSGTGATVNYARKLGREIMVIDPITRDVTYYEGKTTSSIQP